MEQKFEKYNFFVNGLMFKHGIVIKKDFTLLGEGRNINGT